MTNMDYFKIEDGVLKKYVGKHGDIIIPDGITQIGYRAFRGNPWLKNITLPDGQPCPSRIIVPEGVTTISTEAFMFCGGITEIVLPTTLKNIELGAFSYCSQLKSINLPEGITKIPRFAFFGCSSLECVTIPDGVVFVGLRAFSGCASLKNVVLPASLKQISSGAFGRKGAIETVHYKGTEEAFNNIPFTTFNEQIYDVAKTYGNEECPSYTEEIDNNPSIELEDDNFTN